LDQKKVIVLASNSPRRKQILSLGGWDYQILPAEINEDPFPNEEARKYVLRMAENKAQAAAKKAPSSSLVIGADTSVILIDEDGREVILGKPVDEREADKMLRQLRGKVHYVYTSVSILDTEDGMQVSDLCSTAVTMRAYTDSEIKAYIATGDPRDKAGAYAIQHMEFDPVESLKGCYTNVVGLPLCSVQRILSEWGVPERTGITRECNPEGSEPCLVYRKVLNDGSSE
jgi:septum formation protein